jgi:PAS domain S-box-containing protein
VGGSRAGPLEPFTHGHTHFDFAYSRGRRGAATVQRHGRCNVTFVMHTGERATPVGGREISWFEAAFEAAPAAMMVVDADGRVVFANPEAGRVLGRDGRVHKGVMLNTLFAPEQHGFMRDVLATVLATGVSVRRQLSGLDDRGARRSVELAVGKLDAPASMAVVVVQPLAEPVAVPISAEAVAAMEERERLEAMLDCAPAFIIALSRHGTIDFINRTLPQYPRAKVIGAHWHTFFHPDQQVVMEAKFRAMYASEVSQLFETDTPGPDGQPVWFETRIAPIRRGAEIVGAILVSQDVTERKRIHAELLASRHMALLGTLAAGVAHEINTPIQFVGDSVHFLGEAVDELVGLVRTLQSLRYAAAAGRSLAVAIEAAQKAERDVDLPYLCESLPPAFARCIGGLDQISKIVRSLKDFAHPSAHVKVPADLNRIIENVLTIARSEYKFVATLETELGDLPLITCHAAEITQVILNLVVNAAHAIGEFVKDSGRLGVITVATRYERGAAIITVRDTGTGIPEAIRSRIFDPFFTTKEVGKGTGQGLSIAWSMVKERHGGELTFETEVGKGTTFVVRVPNIALPLA